MSLELWAHWGDTFAKSLPHDAWWWDAIEQVRGEAEVIELHRDGRVVGVSEIDGVSHYVFLSLEPQEISGATSGCTCENFNGSYGCRHLLELIACLQDNLFIKASLFSKRIIQEKFTQTPFEGARFIRDRSATTIKAIAQLADQFQVEPTVEEFPDWSDKASSRFVWMLEIAPKSQDTASNWQVTPYLQTLNKAGTGYLKGQVTSPEMLLHYHNDILFDADRQLLSFLTRPRREAEPNLDDILPHLSRSPNFLFKNNPIKVRKATAYLTLLDTPEQSQIQIATTAGPIAAGPVAAGTAGGDCVRGRSNAYSFDFETNELCIIEYPLNSFDLFEHLAQLPPVSPHQRGELVSQLQKLQKKIPVLLPEDEHLRIQPHNGRMTMLLRSNAAGILDFGIRIQCENGVLSLPGALPLIVTTETDEGTVQWIRSPDAEVALATKFIETLDLSCASSIPFSGAIRGYESILKFIEDLGKFQESIEILWDRNSKEILKVLGKITPAQLRVEIKAKRDWFRLTGDCQVGESLLSIEELLAKLDGTKNPLLGSYVQLNEGEWAKIGSEFFEDLEKLREATHPDKNGLLLDSSAAPVIESLSKLEVELEWSKAWQKCMDRLDASRRLNPTLPENLKAELRDYQLDGFTWMSRLAEWGVGGILADDMGLGKTLQAIAILLDRSSSGPSLVLAPTSVGFNWIRELQRFAPSLTPLLYREGDRRERLNSLKPGDIVVSSYAIALRDKSELSDIDWNILVCDEAQALKNSQSKTAKAVSELRSNWTIALTGTPIENHLGELWSLFHVVAPGVFGSWDSFKRKYATPIEKENDPYAKRALASRLRPFVLRRTKSEVLTELPPRTESILSVELSDAERAQYELVRRSAIGELESMLNLTHVKERRFRVLAMLTRLRQFACHPGIVNKQWDRSSSKLDLLCATLLSLQEEGHRALVFSQFTEHLGLIKQELSKREIRFEYLDGSTPAIARQERVDAFQKGNATAFLISLKAGGTGLNLTAADYVIHMDPWWNPAVEDQATDRAHRMGQTKSVMVYRIIAKDTIEEKILEMHESKRDLVDNILEGTNAAASLSVDELMALVRN